MILKQTIKKNFYQLVNIFILLIEDGSDYYWEVDIHLNTKKKMFTGCAIAYFRCTQQEDRW
jgi:hypothetical protein